MDDLKSNYTIIIVSMVGKKKTSDKVDIPELYGSNIIVASIKESLDLTVYTIKNEENLLYNSLIEFNKEIDIDKKTSLDLLFIMDITGSMGPYLTQV